MARLRPILAVLPFSVALVASPLAHTAKAPTVSGPPVVASVHPVRRSRPKKAKRHPSAVVKRRTRWLAKIVQAESGDQSFHTKLAVASFSNRTNSSPS
jgi:hypothetical protein